MNATLAVYPLPSVIETPALSGAAAVVIDVLRATSVLTRAVHSGVKTFIPVPDTAAAAETARQLRLHSPPETVLLGGERFGMPIDGFDLGNSPQHYTPETVGGKTLIFTTTNGTVAMNTAKPAKTVLLASFLNAAAVVDQLQAEEKIVILCSGTDGKETEEDLLLAGCLVKRLMRHRHYSLNAAAERVRQLWQEPANTAELVRQLRQSTGGRNLIQIGLEADIEAAAQIDSINAVPVIGASQISTACNRG